MYSLSSAPPILLNIRYQVELDLQFAAEHHYRTITWSRQYTTALPSNFVDEDLDNEDGASPSVSSTYTASFTTSNTS